MSSTYRLICLEHTPPIILDEISPDAAQTVTHSFSLVRPPDHAKCRLGIGRYSYPLIEIWLPNGNGNYGAWLDVATLKANSDLIVGVLHGWSG